MKDNYSKAYKEVMEILKFVPKESVDKIPQTIIDTFKAKMDNEYDFKVDINKSFEEQDLLEETKAIFANIFRDFWATPYQKERIEAKEKYDRQKLEEEKKEEEQQTLCARARYSDFDRGDGRAGRRLAASRRNRLKRDDGARGCQNDGQFVFGHGCHRPQRKAV